MCEEYRARPAPTYQRSLFAKMRVVARHPCFCPSFANALLIQKAIEKTCKACGLKSIEAEVAGADSCGDVYVDINQTTQALSCILINALQSYKDENGPVWIECSQTEDNGAIVVIRDQGCGMDPVTLEKATQPFFSFRPAGRRRGMGLAQAQRLLSLNRSTIKLASEPDKGTTVTVTFPKI